MELESSISMIACWTWTGPTICIVGTRQPIQSQNVYPYFVTTGQVFGIEVAPILKKPSSRWHRYLGHVKGPQHGNRSLSETYIFAAASQQKRRWFLCDEVAHLPFVLWQDALHMFQEFEQTGYVPDAWTENRQVHIPKPDKGKRSSDGATDVAALRLSASCRIFQWKSPSTQNWVSELFVNHVHGRTTAHS